MKKIFISLFLATLSALMSIGQINSEQTRSWQDMMLDPNANFYDTQKAFYAYWEGKTPEKGMGYSVFKRWENYWSTRIDKHGNFIKPAQIQKEYSKFIENYPQDNRFKSGQPVWKELGPKNRIGKLGYMGIGRVNSIAFHPTDTATIYVGAPAGGFWITHDSGQNWATTTDNLVTAGVSAILVHPDNPDKILIGTGDRDGGNDWGVGTMISEDGGLTWEISNEGMGEITVGFFAHHETDPNTILAAGNGGIFKSTNFGETWTLVSPNQDNYRDIKYKPGDMNIAYASSNNGFFKSTDGGESWSQVTEGISASGRIVIGVSQAAPEKVYLVIGGTFQGCFLSTDSGQSFTLRSDSPNILGGAYAGDDDRNQSWYDLYLHVDPFDDNILHVGGINTWKSIDGGITWSITSHWWGDRTNEVHADHHCVAYNPLNNRMYDGNDGGIYWTDNQGVSWTDISIGLGIGQMYKLAVSATNLNKSMAGFQDNGSATLTDNGWQTTGGGDGFECVIDPFTDAYSYSSVYYGSITRWINNSNGRNVAAEGNHGISEAGAWVTPYTLSEWDGNTMIIGYKNIWVSRNIKSDGEIKWTKVSDNLGGRNNVNCAVVETSPVDSSLFFFARQDGMLFRTENILNNPLWMDLTRDMPQSGTPSDLECHPYRRNIIYMTIGNKVYKSENLGDDWMDITLNLPNLPVNDIAYDRSSNEGLYLGTDAGVYYKDATMSEWTLYGVDLPASVEVSELEIYYGREKRDECKLRASTYGRGMWEIDLAQVDQVALPPYFLNAEKYEGDVELAWNPPLFASQLTGYNIYRNGVLLETVSGNSFLDRGVPEKISLIYSVSAIYLNGNESELSNEVYFQAPVSLPYDQNFEQGTQGWKTVYITDNWQLGNSEHHKISGNDGLFFAISSAYADETSHVQDILYTPDLDLEEYAGQTVTLNFNHAFRVYRDFDKLSVVFRTSPEEDWIKIRDMSATASNRWIWKEGSVDLPEEALINNVQLGFSYDDSNEHAWGAAIDDIKLYVNTTSVFQLALSNQVSVYPNPSGGIISLQISLEKEEDIYVQLLDLSGKTVWNNKYSANGNQLSENLSFEQFAAGQYQLKVTIGQKVYLKKLVFEK
jgi:hypothetical protein